MITNRAVNEAIDYIFRHVEDEIRLEDVAEYCHFSKYYFCRLFKEQTGESVYGFIKRVRLEQSAFQLKVERERTITEIGADFGYSSSNYSWAFRLHYDMTPVCFRRGSFKSPWNIRFFTMKTGRRKALRSAPGRSWCGRCRITGWFMRGVSAAMRGLVDSGADL